MGLVDHFLLDLCLNRFTTRFIDDKYVELLKRFIIPNGKISLPRVTGTYANDVCGCQAVM